MQRFLAILALTIPVHQAAGKTEDAKSDASGTKPRIPIISMLPDGSQLKRVMLPRYDENHKLVAVLKADAMTLVNPEQVAGRIVSFEMYNPDQSLRGRADLQQATYYQKAGLLDSRQPVQIHSDRMDATGSGIYYLLDSGKGFMRGPATTTLFQLQAATTMNLPDSPLRATAAIGMSLFSQALLASPPPPITAADRAAIQADAAPRAAKLKDGQEAIHESLKKDLADSAAVGATVTTFLAQADVPASAAEATIPEPDKPLEIEPNPTQTLINCEGGFYFDPEEGVLVYLKNVTVTDPRFNLSGLNELKIFFSKKEPKPDNKAPNSTPPKDKTDKGPTGFGDMSANFGDVERIVGSGAVLIDQKPTDGKEPIHASGAVFTYNLKKDEILISGGYPWVVQEPQRIRCKDKDGILRISPKTSAFATLAGHWGTLLNLGELKKK